MKRRLAAGLAAAAGALVLAGAASTMSSRPAVQTLLTTQRSILAFAQADGQITWLSRARQGCEMHVRALRTGRTSVTRLSGLSGCPAHLGQVTLANGEAAWTDGRSCGNTECTWDVIAIKAGWKKPRLVGGADIACDSDNCGNGAPVPRPLLAASGGLLAFYGSTEKFLGIEQLVGGRARRLVSTALQVLNLTVGGGGLVQVESRVLTGDGCGCFGVPVWSPDGSKIAYVHGNFEREGPVTGVVAVMNANGSGRRDIADTSQADGGSLSWSPDGTKIAYDALSLGEKVEVANVDGSGTVQLTTGSDPAWSPDGTEIAFVRTDDNANTAGIYVMHPDGTGIQQLASFGPHPGVSAPPAVSGLEWSPDGSRLVFALAGTLELMNADGSNLQELGSGISGGEPAWSPDGSEIVFGDSTGLAVVGADGSGLRQLTTGPDTRPSWSPDGKTIVFASDRDDPYANAGIYSDAAYLELYLVNPDGSDLRPLSFTQPSVWTDQTADYSATGRQLATLPGPAALAAGVAAVGSATAGEHQLITLYDARSGARLSAKTVGKVAPDFQVVGGDDRWVVFLAQGKIWALGIHSLKVVQLAKVAGHPLGLSVTGRQVLWAENPAAGPSRIRLVNLPS